MKKSRSIIGICLSGAIAITALIGGGHAHADIVNEDFLMTAATADGVQVSSRLWELFFGNEGQVDEDAESGARVSEGEIMLIPGGGVFGARITREHPTVEDPSDVSGIEAGDEIISANGTLITAKEQLSLLVAGSEGKPISLHIERGGRELDVSVTPREVGGEYRLGLTLRDTAAGIGTVTYIDPESGCFGGLGHGICDAESKTPIEMTGGRVTGAILGGVQKGEPGKPGELSGILTDRVLGSVSCNTPSGVFGKLDGYTPTSEPIPVGRSSAIHDGDATILSTVKNGKTLEYSVKLFDIDRDGDGTKCFKVKVTDPTLIALTGGIVKGMSGSPIIQDGKLVGAVTHVMVADPTEGYGIFIENMLNAAEGQAQPKAA